MEPLFSEFDPVTSAQWKEKIIKDLKGIEFGQLTSVSPNGFTINPFYTHEDLKEVKSPLVNESDWDICEHIIVHDEKKANQQALKALEGGASGLVFFIFKKIDTKILTKNISLEHIYSQFFLSNDALHVLEDLKEYNGKTNPHDGKVKCFVGADPLCMYVFWGEWHEDQDKDFSLLERLPHIPVNVGLYQEAGATTTNELAIGLSHLNEYFNYLAGKGQLKNKTLHFSHSVGSDFFMEIAKFRAFRKLVNFLQKQYGMDFPIHFHAQTAQLNKSSLDAYTNMLRTTTEGMSAVIGGCNSLYILPFNEGMVEYNDFSARIARNQQHIYKEESYLNKVADIGAGSYYIESLTDELCQKSWERFKEIESKGGFVVCAKNGFLQEMIAKDAEKKLQDLKDGKLVLVGVNKFQNMKETVEVFSGKKYTGGTIKVIRPIRLSETFEQERSNTSNLAAK
jgi:methylmalonyl-CoA mutase